MADENDVVEVKKPDKGGLNNKIKLIIVVAVVLVAVIAGLLVVLKFMKPKASDSLNDPIEETDTTSSKIRDKDKKPEKIIIIDLAPIKVNPSGTKGTRFLQSTISLQVDNDLVSAEITEKSSIILDKTASILGSLTILDIDQFNVPDYEGLTMKDRIRRRIMEALNEILTTGKVINVYFKEFIVQ